MRRLVFLVCIVILSAPAVADDQPPQRAKPPTWTRDVLDAFFEDARKELVGERPTDAPAHKGETASVGTKPNDEVFKWSELIDSDTLTTEIKRISNSLAGPLANPGKFKAGGYQQCRQDFSVLAVLFAVTAEHEASPRWQDDAAALRDAFASAGANCKVGTDQSYAEANARQLELADMIRGQRPATGEAKPIGRWSDLSERELLMKRMETALEERVSPALADARAFKRQSDDVRHEAQLLAMLAVVMQREEYDYWDDDDFVDLANQLRRSAQQLSVAAADGNYEQAREAAGNATKSCSNCHEGYRG